MSEAAVQNFPLPPTAAFRAKDTPGSGLSFGRLIQTRGRKESERVPFVMSQGWNRDAASIIEIEKSAVGGIGLSSFPETNTVVADAFANLARLSALSRLASQRVPIGTAVFRGGTRPIGFITQEGAGIPLTKSTFARTVLTPVKAAALAVVTNELMRSAAPGAQALLGNMMLAAVAKAADAQFLLLPGATRIASTGSSVAALDADLATAIDTLDSQGGYTEAAQWVISARLAAKLALLRSSGVPAYPGLSVEGGILAGLPVVVTAAEIGNSGGHEIALVDVAGLLVSDQTLSDVTVDVGDQALVEMSDAPTANSLVPTAGASPLVSVFQVDSVALRTCWRTGWLTDANAAVVLAGVSI